MDTITTMAHGARRHAADFGAEDSHESAPTALDELLEAALIASGGSAGCCFAHDGGAIRLLSVAGDRMRAAAITDQRCSAQLFDAAPAVTIFRAEPVAGAGALRYHAIACQPREYGAVAGGILVLDAPREPTPAMRRMLALLARQACRAAQSEMPSSPAARATAAPAVADGPLAEACAEEGRRVTAELHAMLGHELSSAALALDTALPGLDGPPACLNAVRAVAGLLQGAVGRCRERMASGYNADAAADGFAATLRRLSATVARRGGVKVHVHVASGVSERLTASSAYHLHHMAIDAIVGAVRHSQGTMVVVSIAADPDTIVLQVDDDGSGAADHALHAKRRVESIEAVAQMLGGDVSIRPRQPRGLSVYVRVPRTLGARLTRSVTARRKAPSAGVRIAS